MSAPKKDLNTPLKSETIFINSTPEEIKKGQLPLQSVNFPLNASPPTSNNRPVYFYPNTLSPKNPRQSTNMMASVSLEPPIQRLDGPSNPGSAASSPHRTMDSNNQPVLSHRPLIFQSSPYQAELQTQFRSVTPQPGQTPLNTSSPQAGLVGSTFQPPVTYSPTPQSTHPRPHIYSAVYSGVPVYELMCRNVAVMRRRSDSYLNATQILKVAGIDKGRRTKILEKEIMNGEHEKVQGGYGKYQGTWIPYERAIQLARQYAVESYIRPLLDFERPAGQSSMEVPSLPQTQQAIEARAEQTAKSDANDLPQHKSLRNLSNQQIPSPSESVPSSPPKIQSKPPGKRKRVNKQIHIEEKITIPRTRNAKLTSPIITSPVLPSPSAEIPSFAPLNIESSTDRERHELISIFTTRNRIPDFLTLPIPCNIDMDMIIDEMGHAAIHWAAALARPDILRLLLEKGGNPGLINHYGETALIRACCATNSYNGLNFKETLDLLYLTIPHADLKERTVLHHISIGAGSKARLAASKYYMECLLECIASKIGLFDDIIDKQDRNGDTALNIAARQGNKAIVEMLLDVGADPNIKNNAGLSLIDFGFDVTHKRHKKSEVDKQTVDAAMLLMSGSFPSTPVYSKDADESVTMAAEALMRQRRGASTATGTRSPAQISEIAAENFSKINNFMDNNNEEVNQVVKRLADNMMENYDNELRPYKETFETTQADLNQMTVQMAETCKNIRRLKSENVKLPELEHCVKNLESTLAEEHNRTPLPLPEVYGTDAMPVDFPTIDAHTPEELRSQIERLRKELAEKEANERCLRDELVEIKGSGGYEDFKCKQIIAACCDMTMSEVDQILGPLMEAIEVDADVEVSKIAGFMGKVKYEEAIRMNGL